MSRSRKHSPHLPISHSESEKSDKVLASKRLRRISKVALAKDPEAVLPIPREVFDRAWEGSKDGRVYRPHCDPRFLRK